MWIKGFFDQDIEKLLEEDADIIGFSYYRCNGDMTRGRLIEVNDEIILGGGTEAVNSSWNHHSSLLYRRKMVQEAKIECPTTRHEDEIFRHKCLYVSKKIIYLNKPIFMYRNNSTSETHRKQKPEDLYVPILDSWNTLIGWHQSLNSDDEQVVLLCKKMMCLYGIEGIEMLYRNNVSEKRIQEIADQYLYKNILKNYTFFGLSPNSQKRIEMYYHSHRKFVIKNIIIGIIILAAKRGKKVPFVRRVYEKRNYPMIVSEH